jgi:hypothetical protein
VCEGKFSSFFFSTSFLLFVPRKKAFVAYEKSFLLIKRRESFAKTERENNPRRKTTAQQQRMNESMKKDVRRKLKKQTRKICNFLAEKNEQTLMLVFTSKYTIIFCAFMQAAAPSWKGRRKIPQTQANYSGIHAERLKKAFLSLWKLSIWHSGGFESKAS